MPPKGRKKNVVASKTFSIEVDEEFPPMNKILEDKSQPSKLVKGRKNIAEAAAVDETAAEVGVEMGQGDGLANGVSNGVKKVNGGDTSDVQEKETDMEKLLVDGDKGKEESWKLEFSPGYESKEESVKEASKSVEADSEDQKSDEEVVTSNGKVVDDETKIYAAEEVDMPEAKEVEEVPTKRGRKKAAARPVETESEDQKSEDEGIKSNGDVLDEEEDAAAKHVETESEDQKTEEEGNGEAEVDTAEEMVEKVPEKRGRNKAAQKPEVREKEQEPEPKKQRGRPGRKAAEEPKKALPKRGRQKAEVIEFTEEDLEVAKVVDEMEAEGSEEDEQQPKPKRGRKKVAEKPTAKRGRKKQEDIEKEESEEEELPRPKRGRKRAELVEIADEESEEEEKPVARRGRKRVPAEESEPVARRGGRKNYAEVDIADEDFEEEKPAAKRGHKNAKEVEISDEESEVEEKPVAKHGRKKVEVSAEESEEEPKPVARRGGRKNLKKVATVDEDSEEEPVSTRGGQKNYKEAENSDEDFEEEKPMAKRGRRKAEVVELEHERPRRGQKKVTEDQEKVTGRRGRNRAEAVEEIEIVEEEVKAPGRKGRKRKVDVPESSESKKKSKEFDDDDISDFNREVRVAMTRDFDIDEMARKASPPHLSRREVGNVPKPADETYVKVKYGKYPAAKSGGRKRANQESEDSKPGKIQKEEPAKQGKSGAKKAQIPDVTALEFGSDAKTSDGKDWNFKAASWNVNGVRAWLEKNGMSYLQHEDPDVLCLQETKCSVDKLPEELYIEGYHCHWLAGDKDGYSGVGLISKEKPISITEGIGIKEHDNEGRVITAEYEKFYLVNTYVPNSGRGLPRLDYRKTWDVDFRAYLKKLDEKKPVILCGDLNVAHEEIDLANPKSNKKTAGFTQEERDGFSALLEEGFIDTFRHLYPDQKGAYSYWTYMANARAKNVGWRLDYFVISERFKENLCDSLIRKDVMGSDHCPVTLLLHV